MPEVTIPVDDTPVVAEEPHVVVLPIQGEVLTAFSVDQLLYNETLDDWRTHDRGGYRRGGRRCRPGRLRRDGLLHHRRSLMGTTVVIQHSGGYETTYANLQAEPAVETGDTVSAGQTIGAVGTTAAAGRPPRAPTCTSPLQRMGKLWTRTHFSTADAAAAERPMAVPPLFLESGRPAADPLGNGPHGPAQEDSAQYQGHQFGDGEGQPHQRQDAGVGQQPCHRQRTTSWRHTEVIRLYSGLPIA